MDFLRAFTYISQDSRWLSKLAKLALFLVLCPLPVIGLLFLCAILGYLAEIIHNVSNDYPRPLPVWAHLSQHIAKGAPLLLALVVYHLPPAILLVFLLAFRNVIAVSLFGGLTFVAILVGLLPLLLLYIAFAWSLLVIGLWRYSETWEGAALYQFNKSLRSLQNNSLQTLQWLIYTMAANIFLLLLLPIAFLGPLLFIPVQGYLTGCYCRRLRAAKWAYRQGRA